MHTVYLHWRRVYDVFPLFLQNRSARRRVTSDSMYHRCANTNCSAPPYRHRRPTHSDFRSAHSHHRANCCTH